MASANDPTPSTGIQAAPPPASSTAVQAEAPSIPLPPQPKRAPVTAEQLARWTRPLDALLALSVLALAFLTASFAARNSDAMLHLATGRALFNGSYHFGQDPFAYTTQGVRWVNHSWLFDAVLYLSFQAAGGAGVVLLKALLIVALAGFMLAIRRPGQSLWLPALCGGIAALAISQRVYLQPVVVSYLFLAATLYLLAKPTTAADVISKRRTVLQSKRRHLWLLPVLFLFWVNLDDWFFLGPLTVALYWAGQLIQDSFAAVREGPDRRGMGDNRTLAGVLAVGLIACLINPHHIYAFTLPAQFIGSAAGSLLQQDGQFEAMFWGVIDYYQKGAGWSVVGVAYLVLLGLGVLSFALNYQDWRGWRIVVWAAFAALSGWHARAIPFFAVVGGPIAALNLQDAAVRFFGAAPRLTPGWRQWAIGGRLLTLVGGVVLLLLAWPGWLHATVAHGELASRNVAWRIEFEPSLKQAAEQLQQWHADGILTAGELGLNFSPEVGDACAWFAPDEKSFFDRRLALFEKAATQYLAAAKALEVDPLAKDQNQEVTTRLEPLVQVLRKNGANHLIFHYADLQRFQSVFMMLESDRSQQWRCIYRDGRTAIYRWDDPDKQAPASGLARVRVPDDRRAFGPPSDSEPPLTERAAAPEPPSLIDHYLHPRQLRPLSADEGFMDLQYFFAVHPHYKKRALDNWLNAQAAGLVGAGAGAPLPGDPLVRAALVDSCFGAANPARVRKAEPAGITYIARSFVYLKHDGAPGPHAVPLLAVRSCRRALLENPNDGLTWYRMQGAYGILSEQTGERDWYARLPLLQSVRKVQRISALNHAVLLDPENGAAHWELAGLYQQMSAQRAGGYLDLELKHLTEYVRLAQQAGPQRGDKPEEFTQRIKKLQDAVDQLDAVVKKAQNDYEVGQVTKPTMRAKAEFALSLGLGGQARDELLHSLEVSVEPDALRLQLLLMIFTGSIEGEAGIRVGLDNTKQEVEATGRKPEWGDFGTDPYKVPLYDWLQVLVAAASGDYRVADELLVPLIPVREQAHRDFLRAHSRAESLALFLDSDPRTGGGALLDTQMTPMVLWRGLARTMRLETLKALMTSKPRTADIYALRGILALEAGDTAHAAKMFAKVRESKEAAFTPMAKYYLDLLEANK